MNKAGVGSWNDKQDGANRDGALSWYGGHIMDMVDMLGMMDMVDMVVMMDIVDVVIILMPGFSQDILVSLNWRELFSVWKNKNYSKSSMDLVS